MTVKSSKKNLQAIFGNIADRRPGAPLLMNVGSNEQREADERWFAENLSRTHCVRAVGRGEFPVKGLDNVKSVILVKERTGRRKYPLILALDQLRDSDAFLSGVVAAILQKPCPADDQETRDGWLAGCLVS